MNAPIIDGVDRALSRFRRHTHTTTILRHQRDAAEQRIPTADHETPDKYQVIGIPLLIMRTPPLRRREIDEQHI